MLVNPRAVTILIPAYNEAETLGPILPQLKQLHPDAEILIVDDGSGDGTAQIGAQSGARVVRESAEGLGVGECQGPCREGAGLVEDDPPNVARAVEEARGHRHAVLDAEAAQVASGVLRRDGRRHRRRTLR